MVLLLYVDEGQRDNNVCSWKPSLAQFYVQLRSRMSQPSVVQLQVWVKSGIVGIITRSSLLQHIEKQSQNFSHQTIFLNTTVYKFGYLTTNIVYMFYNFIYKEQYQGKYKIILYISVAIVYSFQLHYTS